MAQSDRMKHQNLQSTSTTREHDSTKPAYCAEFYKQPSPRTWNDANYLAREVAAACFSSCSPMNTHQSTDMALQANTLGVLGDPQDGNIRDTKIPVSRKDSGLTTNMKGAENCEENYKPYVWQDYKRKLFSEWLDGQPDAHDDVWGFSSSSCTPICLSRSSSVVHIASEVDNKTASR